MLSFITVLLFEFVLNVMQLYKVPLAVNPEEADIGLAFIAPYLNSIALVVSYSNNWNVELAGPLRLRGIVTNHSITIILNGAVPVRKVLTYPVVPVATSSQYG